MNSRHDLKNKGFLFGLYQAQEAIKESSTVILVEGQFDVMSMVDRGFVNTVGLMGSSLSNMQAHRLIPIATKMVLVLDGDEAGRSGADKIRAKWKSTFDITQFRLPDGMDPATYDFNTKRGH